MEKVKINLVNAGWESDSSESASCHVIPSGATREKRITIFKTDSAVSIQSAFVYYILYVI